MVAPESLVSRFRPVGRLGRGTFGTVFLAEDRTLGRQVALKISRDLSGTPCSGRALFLREARALAGVSHPNVVRIFDIAVESRRVILALEYIRGRTLERLLEERRPTLAQVLTIAEDILSALSAIHETGVVHRDLKPGNVMVDVWGRVSLMDFGFAQRAADSSSSREAGFVIGTPYYMAPEQWRGGQVHAETDLFALGVLLYEALAGTRPFTGEDPAELAECVLHEPAAPLRELAPRVTPAIASIVEQALEKEPERRFRSARQMSQRFEAWMPEPAARESSHASLATRRVPTPDPLGADDLALFAGAAQPSEPGVPPAPGPGRSLPPAQGREPS